MDSLDVTEREARLRALQAIADAAYKDAASGEKRRKLESPLTNEDRARYARDASRDAAYKRRVSGADDRQAAERSRVIADLEDRRDAGVLDPLTVDRVRESMDNHPRRGDMLRDLGDRHEAGTMSAEEYRRVLESLQGSR